MGETTYVSPVPSVSEQRDIARSKTERTIQRLIQARAGFRDARLRVSAEMDAADGFEAIALRNAAELIQSQEREISAAIARHQDHIASVRVAAERAADYVEPVMADAVPLAPPTGQPVAISADWSGRLDDSDALEQSAEVIPIGFSLADIEREIERAPLDEEPLSRASDTPAVYDGSADFADIVQTRGSAVDISAWQRHRVTK